MHCGARGQPAGRLKIFDNALEAFAGAGVALCHPLLRGMVMFCIFV
jgi:hypothetical protein